MGHATNLAVETSTKVCSTCWQTVLMTCKVFVGERFTLLDSLLQTQGKGPLV